MAVPSVSVSVHDRYGPAIRDKITEKLRIPMVETAYHMLTSTHLGVLAGIESPEAPIVRLYL